MLMNICPLTLYEHMFMLHNFDCVLQLWTNFIMQGTYSVINDLKSNTQRMLILRE